MEGLCPCGHEPTGSIVPVSQLLLFVIIIISVIIIYYYYCCCCQSPVLRDSLLIHYFIDSQFHLLRITVCLYRHVKLKLRNLWYYKLVFIKDCRYRMLCQIAFYSKFISIHALCQMISICSWESEHTVVIRGERGNVFTVTGGRQTPGFFDPHR